MIIIIMVMMTMTTKSLHDVGGGRGQVSRRVVFVLRTVQGEESVLC